MLAIHSASFAEEPIASSGALFPVHRSEEASAGGTQKSWEAAGSQLSRHRGGQSEAWNCSYIHHWCLFLPVPCTLHAAGIHRTCGVSARSYATWCSLYERSEKLQASMVAVLTWVSGTCRGSEMYPFCSVGEVPARGRLRKRRQAIESHPNRPTLEIL